MFYVLNEHDKHILRSFEDGLRMTCVFYPALVGGEIHQTDGSYAQINRQGETVEN